MKTVISQKANEVLKDYPGDILSGGLADKNKPVDFDESELAEGIKVEMEHTNCKGIAREIAMDHLREDSKYYTKLRQIEDHQ